MLFSCWGLHEGKEGGKEMEVKEDHIVLPTIVFTFIETLIFGVRILPQKAGF